MMADVGTADVSSRVGHCLRGVARGLADERQEQGGGCDERNH
jgi:hypothetical protein